MSLLLADALPGVLRWQSRVWQLVTKLRGARQLGDVPNPSLLKKKELAETRKIWENKNYAIEQVAELYCDNLCALTTGGTCTHIH